MGPICFSGTVLLIGDLSCPVSAHPVALWAFRGGQCYSVSTDPKESCHTGDLSPTVRGAGPMPKPCLYSALSLPRHCPVRAGPRLLPHYLIEDTRGPASARSWVSNAGPSGPGRERPAEASPPPSAALPGKGPESGCRWEGGAGQAGQSGWRRDHMFLGCPRWSSCGYRLGGGAPGAGPGWGWESPGSGELWDPDSLTPLVCKHTWPRSLASTWGRGRGAQGELPRLGGVIWAGGPGKSSPAGRASGR